jgi:predicted site-specific integrase-resolvase
MNWFKTAEAARLLGVTYARLFSLIRSGRLVSPRKDGSGDYVWVAEDVDRARSALAVDRRRREVVA